MPQIVPQFDNKGLKEKMSKWVTPLNSDIYICIWRIFNTHYSFFYCSLSEEILSSEIPKKD